MSYSWQLFCIKGISKIYLSESSILFWIIYRIIYSFELFQRLESRLLEVFQHVHQAYQGLESRMKAEGFRVRVMQIFRAWEDWAVYPKDYLIRLQNAFLGLTSSAVVRIFFRKFSLIFSWILYFIDSAPIYWYKINDFM